MCINKGKRLKEAPVKLQEMSMWLTDTSRSSTLELYDGDSDAFLEYSSSLRLTHVDLNDKFGWVGQPPYCFANIVSPEWALLWRDSFSSVAEDKHHRVTVWLNNRFSVPIARISDGDIASIPQDVLNEQQVWEKMPLCSDDAEGFHRGINCEVSRSSGARVPFLFSSLRLDQNLALCNEVCETEEGQKRFRFNWVNFSRVLQTRSRGFLQRKRDGTIRYKFLQIYRLDHFARVDWSGVGTHVVPGSRAQTLPLTDSRKMLADYISKAVVAGSIYTVPLEGNEDDLCFQVLRVSKKVDPINSW